MLAQDRARQRPKGRWSPRPGASGPGALNPHAPFGGHKQSGHGRELGHFGIEELLQVKSLQLQLVLGLPTASGWLKAK